MSTTSGRVLATSVDRLGAVGRLADDLDVGLAPTSSTEKPLRTSAWSSATTTRIDHSASP